MKKILLPLLLVNFIIYNLQAQNVGIGTASPNASAQLDIYADNKGILIPRVALTALNSATPVVSPANGLLVYNISTGAPPPNTISPGFYYWDAVAVVWVRLFSANESLWNATATDAPALNYNDDIYRKSKVAIGTGLAANNALLQVGTGTNTDLGFLVSGNTGALSTVPDIGAGSRMMFYPGKSAFRAGYVSGIQWDNTKTGFYSTALGRSTVASGVSSFATGDSSVASGIFSIAMGQQDSAIANYTVAIGYQSKAIASGARAIGQTALAFGSNSTAIGTAVIAEGTSATAIGHQPNATGNYSTALGYQTYTQGNYSAALGSTAKAYGNYSVALGNNTQSNGASSTALGYNTTSQGAFSTAMGNNTQADGASSTAMGNATTASGEFSTAMGYNTRAGYSSTAMGNSTTASGDYSTAMGWNTSAAGHYSTAIGRETKANVNYTTAMGFNTDASGGYSTAMGTDTKSPGNYSTAMGLATNAGALASFSIGRYNDPVLSSSPTGWALSDPLFYIGNGLNSGALSNALIVYKNANTDIKGYTRLGDITEAAPRIKIKKLTGTSAATEGTWVNIAHGLTQSKIIGVNIIMNVPGFVNLPPSYTFQAEYEYQYQVAATNIVVLNTTTNSANILNKSFTVLITYEE